MLAGVISTPRLLPRRIAPRPSFEFPLSPTSSKELSLSDFCDWISQNYGVSNAIVRQVMCNRRGSQGSIILSCEVPCSSVGEATPVWVRIRRRPSRRGLAAINKVFKKPQPTTETVQFCATPNTLYEPCDSRECFSYGPTQNPSSVLKLENIAAMFQYFVQQPCNHMATGVDCHCLCDTLSKCLQECQPCYGGNWTITQYGRPMSYPQVVLDAKNLYLRTSHENCCNIYGPRRVMPIMIPTTEGLGRQFHRANPATHSTYSQSSFYPDCCQSVSFSNNSPALAAHLNHDHYRTCPSHQPPYPGFPYPTRGDLGRVPGSSGHELSYNPYPSYHIYHTSCPSYRSHSSILYVAPLHPHLHSQPPVQPVSNWTQGTWGPHDEKIRPDIGPSLSTGSGVNGNVNDSNYETKTAWGNNSLESQCTGFPQPMDIVPSRNETPDGCQQAKEAPGDMDVDSDINTNAHITHGTGSDQRHVGFDTTLNIPTRQNSVQAHGRPAKIENPRPVELSSELVTEPVKLEDPRNMEAFAGEPYDLLLPPMSPITSNQGVPSVSMVHSIGGTERPKAKDWELVNASKLSLGMVMTANEPSDPAYVATKLSQIQSAGILGESEVLPYISNPHLVSTLLEPQSVPKGRSGGPINITADSGRKAQGDRPANVAKIHLRLMTCGTLESCEPSCGIGAGYHSSATEKRVQRQLPRNFHDIVFLSGFSDSGTKLTLGPAFNHQGSVVGLNCPIVLRKLHELTGCRAIDRTHTTISPELPKLEWEQIIGVSVCRYQEAVPCSLKCNNYDEPPIWEQPPGLVFISAYPIKRLPIKFIGTPFWNPALASQTPAIRRLKRSRVNSTSLTLQPTTTWPYRKKRKITLSLASLPCHTLSRDFIGSSLSFGHDYAPEHNLPFGNVNYQQLGGGNTMSGQGPGLAIIQPGLSMNIDTSNTVPMHNMILDIPLPELAHYPVLTIPSQHVNFAPPVPVPIPSTLIPVAQLHHGVTHRYEPPWTTDGRYMRHIRRGRGRANGDQDGVTPPNCFPGPHAISGSNISLGYSYLASLHTGLANIPPNGPGTAGTIAKQSHVHIQHPSVALSNRAAKNLAPIVMPRVGTLSSPIHLDAYHTIPSQAIHGPSNCELQPPRTVNQPAPDPSPNRPTDKPTHNSFFHPNMPGSRSPVDQLPGASPVLIHVPEPPSNRGGSKGCKHCCNICDASFRRPNLLRDHFRIHTGEETSTYRCKFEGCTRVYKSQSNMARHFTMVHASGGKHGSCGKQTPREIVVG